MRDEPSSDKMGIRGDLSELRISRMGEKRGLTRKRGGRGGKRNLQQRCGGKMSFSAKRRGNTQKEELGECGVEEGRCGQRSVGLEKRRGIYRLGAEGRGGRLGV